MVPGVRFHLQLHWQVQNVAHRQSVSADARSSLGDFHSEPGSTHNASRTKSSSSYPESMYTIIPMFFNNTLLNTLPVSMFQMLHCSFSSIQDSLHASQRYCATSILPLLCQHPLCLVPICISNVFASNCFYHILNASIQWTSATTLKIAFTEDSTYNVKL